MTKASKAGYVTNKNHYCSLAIVAVVVGILAHLSGVQQGDTECNLETARLEVKNQKDVYDADNKINSDLPDVYNTSEWSEWMKDQIPYFSSE